MGKLGKKTVGRLEDLFRDYPDRPSALLSALYVVQEEEKHLSEENLTRLAEIIGMPKSVIYEVVTFYSLFSLERVGGHVIRLCRNICCFLRGGERILEKLEEILGIKAGETTADGLFTLELSECLGACDRAPMMMIDEKTYGPLEEEDLKAILDEYR